MKSKAMERHGNGMLHRNGKLAGNASLAQYTLYGYGCRKLSES